MSIDRLKEVGSPRNVSRTHSPREMNRLKEQAADALRLRDKFHALQEEVSIHLHVHVIMPRGLADEGYGKADCVCVCVCIPALTAQRLQCDEN